MTSSVLYRKISYKYLLDGCGYFSWYMTFNALSPWGYDGAILCDRHIGGLQVSNVFVRPPHLTALLLFLVGYNMTSTSEKKH